MQSLIDGYVKRRSGYYRLVKKEAGWIQKRGEGH